MDQRPRHEKESPAFLRALRLLLPLVPLLQERIERFRRRSQLCTDQLIIIRARFQRARANESRSTVNGIAVYLVDGAHAHTWPWPSSRAHVDGIFSCNYRDHLSLLAGGYRRLEGWKNNLSSENHFG